MALHCPGRDTKAKLESALMACPGCGRMIEIFGDEQKVHCRCGQWVFRETLPSCAQWCESAVQCFGNIGSLSSAACGQGNAGSTEEQKERFKRLQARITNALASCPLPKKKVEEAT